LRLDGIEEEQKREIDLLKESRKLAKAAWKLVGLKKRDPKMIPPPVDSVQ
jgi:hypothetical protein